MLPAPQASHGVSSEEESHEKAWHERHPGCPARRRGWFQYPIAGRTGRVAVVFTTGGFIVGVGGGMLTSRGKHYPFTVSGMSIGFTIGTPAVPLRPGLAAFNCRTPMA